MKFQAVAEITRGVPVMGEREGRKLYDHVCETQPQHVLEIGTAWGVSGCYIAAALDENGHGRLTTIDHRDADYRDPTADELFAKAGLERWIDRVRIGHSSYTWWLKDEIQRRSDPDGNIEPLYDFCFLDGSHNWTIDGLAVVLVERLLTSGGWLLLDDLNWSYAEAEQDIQLSPPSDKMFAMSPDEVRTPHVAAIVDVIIRSHPAFAEVRIQDGRWAWCRKDEGAPRRFSVETTRPLPVLASLALQRGATRARAAAQQIRSARRPRR